MMMKIVYTARSKTFHIWALAIILLTSSLSSLAQDPAFDELPLNGLAAYKELRKEYYIGGLYLESLSQDAGSTFNFSGRKRMEIRVTNKRWSTRSFANTWNQLILINNDQESLEEFEDRILTFIDMPKGNLITGDRVTIDLDPERGTTVYLNGHKVFTERNNAFFDILLNTWIGQRPPSSDFKNHILTLPTDAAGTELLVRYEAQSTDKAREKKVAAWITPPKSTTKTTAAKTTKTASASSAAVPPPNSDTMVTAKRASKAAPAPTTRKPITVVQPNVAAPAPVIALSKPSLGAAPTPTPSPAAKTTTAEKPAEKPKPAAKPVTKTKVATADTTTTAKQATSPDKKAAVSAEDAEQAKLMKSYRRNVLKLTFLNTQYPKRAMDFNQQGLVVLAVKINRKGKLLDIIEKTTSDHKLLNNAARKAIKKTAPYPEVPEKLKGEEIEISLPFNFKL